MKKIIKLVIITTVVILCFINININNTKDGISSIKLANIEALASGESSGEWITCYRTISCAGSGNSTHVTYCGDCSAHIARGWSNSDFCRK